MAEGKGSKAANEEGAKGNQEEEEKTYHVDRLLSESYDFLGVPPHVAAGALDGQKKNFTIDEAKEAVKAFQKHEPEVDNDPLGNVGEAEAREEGS